MPARTLSQCPHAGCPELVPSGERCPKHMRVGWASSTHRSELPRDWAKRRLRILHRDGHRCQWPVGGDSLICGAKATEVDAITPTSLGGSHTDDRNLRALCTHHHRIKSGREGRAAR